MPRRSTSRRPRVLDAETQRRHAIDSRAYELALQDARREFPVFTAENLPEAIRYQEARREAHRARLLAEGWTPPTPSPVWPWPIAPLPPVDEMRRVIGQEASSLTDAQVIDTWKGYTRLARILCGVFTRRQEVA
jgi:hypothetical protein